MATDVTIVEAWINDGHYGHETGSFGTMVIQGDAGISMAWIGSVENGVGTYAGVSSIKAQQYLKFDSEHLLVGDLTTVKGGGGDYTLAVGSEGVAEDGQIQLIGSKTTDVKIAGISFHNEAAASATYDKVAEIYAKRYADDDAAELIFGVSVADGTFYDRYHMTLAEFMPDVTNSLNLGHPSYYWANGYITNVHGVVFYLEDSNTYLDVTSAGDLQFTDAVYGSITLSELIQGAASPWEEASNGAVTLVGSGSYVVVDSIQFNDSNTYIEEDSAGNMVFTDAVTGSATLAELAAGVGSVSFGNQYEIPATNAGGDNYVYDPNFKWDGTDLTVGNVVPVGDSSVYTLGSFSSAWDTLYVDTVQSLDGDSGTDGRDLTITSGIAGGGTWDSGHLYIKGADALSGHAGSLPGNLYLVGGLSYNASTRYVYLGTPLEAGAYQYLSCTGSAATISLTIQAKGSGHIQLGSYSMTGNVIAKGLQIGGTATAINLTRTNSAITSMTINAGTASSGAVAASLVIRSGAGSSFAGYEDGANLYLIPGQEGNSAGVPGDIYIGSGGEGYLPANADSAPDVVCYDSATGLLSYTALGAGGGGGVSFPYIVDAASTNTSIEIAEFRRTSSGTPAAGIGGYLTLSVENDNNVITPLYIEHILTDVSDGAEDSMFRVRGQSNSSLEDYMFIVGQAAVTGYGIYAIGIGQTVKATGTGTISIGSHADATNTNNISIGSTAGSTSGTVGTNNISIGASSNSGTSDIGTSTVAIGNIARTIGDFAVSIGGGAGNTTGTSNTYAISIGFAANNGTVNIGQYSIGVGRGTVSSATGSIAIGRSTDASAQGAIIMGYHTAAQTNTLSDSFKLMWDGTTAFHVGTLLGTQVTVNADPDTNLTAAANGVIAYDSTKHEFRAYVNSGWVALGGGGATYSAALTDGTPTDAQIDSATGTTPAAVGAGWQCTILDTDGSALIYLIVSDGANWQYSALTIAV